MRTGICTSVRKAGPAGRLHNIICFKKKEKADPCTDVYKFIQVLVQDLYKFIQVFVQYMYNLSYARNVNPGWISFYYSLLYRCLYEHAYEYSYEYLYKCKIFFSEIPGHHLNLTRVNISGI